MTNVYIEGYNIFHTATKTAKGGTAIYINNDFDSLEHTELKINNKEQMD